jgi:hypothetical protein
VSKSHRIIYVESKDGEFRSAHCVWPCGWKSARYPLIQNWQIEDEWRKHLAHIEVVKAHLRRGREPSLQSQYDYYVARADEEDNEHLKEEWVILAEGLRHRLGTPGSDVMLPGLDGMA